jgi:hypothetical protein
MATTLLLGVTVWQSWGYLLFLVRCGQGCRKHMLLGLVHTTVGCPEQATSQCYEGASRAPCVLQNSSILGPRPSCRIWPKDLKRRHAVACVAHVQQGSWPHTTTHTLMHSAHRARGTLYDLSCLAQLQDSAYQCRIPDPKNFLGYLPLMARRQRKNETSSLGSTLCGGRGHLVKLGLRWGVTGGTIQQRA